MPFEKKKSKFNAFALDRKYRSSGFSLWRVCFYATSRRTGENSAFFIECFSVNPAFSPKKVIFLHKKSENHFKPNYESIFERNPAVDEALMQVVTSEDDEPEELNKKSSYILVRAGRYGKNSNCISQFFPSNDFTWDKNQQKAKCASCVFASDFTEGVLLQSSLNGENRASKIEWKLRFEQQNSDYFAGKANQDSIKCSTSLKTVFSGLVKIDGEDFLVTPKKCFGYSECLRGRNFSQTFFHISSSEAQSIITSKPLFNTFFAVHAKTDKKIYLQMNLEGKKIEITNFCHAKNGQNMISFVEMPSDSKEQKFHWSCSFKKKRLIIDIDAYCNSQQMLIRDYEIPTDENRVLKIFSGAHGNGEIRIFQKRGKGIELLEHLKFSLGFCEYGSIVCE